LSILAHAAGNREWVPEVFFVFLRLYEIEVFRSYPWSDLKQWRPVAIDKPSMLLQLMPDFGVSARKPDTVFGGTRRFKVLDKG
jgi:hypothetical protein